MQTRSLRTRILRLALIAARVYFLLLIVLGVFQRSLIYFPARATEPALLEEATQLNAAPWRTAAGEIIGWKRSGATSAAANRLVVFHGNAGNALDRVHYIDTFGNLEGGRLWEVYLFEYPAYGARPGKISEKSFREAGAAALTLLRAADARPIYLLGESLGGGLACALAHDQPDSVAGLFLVTPFSSLPDVAAHHYPFIPVRLLLHDRWDNVAALSAYQKPLAMMLAGNDTIVPIKFGERLFQAAHEPKRLWRVPGVDHNDLTLSAQAALWWPEVSDFLLGHGSPTNRGP